MNIPSHLLPVNLDNRHVADYARKAYFLVAPPGTTPDHIVDPDYWTHIAQRLKPYDRVEIVAADGTFDMEVRVTAVDPRGLWARVRPLRVAEGKFAILDAPGVYPDKDGYSTEWGGEHRWRIIRGSDVVAHGFPDQASAIEALQNIKAAKRPGTPVPLVPRMSDPPQPGPAPEQPPAPGEGPQPEQGPAAEEPTPATAASRPLRGAAAASAARKAAA